MILKIFVDEDMIYEKKNYYTSLIVSRFLGTDVSTCITLCTVEARSKHFDASPCCVITRFGFGSRFLRNAMSCGREECPENPLITTISQRTFTTSDLLSPDAKAISFSPFCIRRPRDPSA